VQCAWHEGTLETPAVDLLLATPRPKVLRRLWAQLAALGVGRIMLVNAERVERNYFDTHWLRADVYRPLLIEGLQQARDTRLPTVTVHRRLRPFVEDELDLLCPDARRLLADPSSSASISSVVQGDDRRRVLLAVGPEGGWNAFELALLTARHFVCVGLGPRTLRTDTACVALLALVHEAIRLADR
jgi:RsmE family RNA methyltransferase